MKIFIVAMSFVLLLLPHGGKLLLFLFPCNFPDNLINFLFHLFLGHSFIKAEKNRPIVMNSPSKRVLFQLQSHILNEFIQKLLFL